MGAADISKKKQTIIAGGLISSAGVFISKLIGLFYAIPYSAILGSDANSAYYGVAFSLYSYILNICMAGFPFAIATLVAKYFSRGDYQTTLLIKKLSMNIMLVFGAISMIIVILFASPLASLVMPAEGKDVDIMRNVLVLISFALFFVPVLSSVRGFYQGLKHMEVYALSQVLEQIGRVIFLLTASALAVYVFNQDRVWAVYFGVISTSIAAILAIVHIKYYDRKVMKEFKRLAKEQQREANHDKYTIVKELIFIAFPYLIAAILGYSDTIVNTIFMNQGLLAYGMDSSEALVVMGAINLGVMKLMSIPMILAPGFSAAIIPHITSAIANHDFKLVRKNIVDCVDIVLYIAAPISLCLLIFAKPIYYVLFYTENLELCAEVLSWYSLEAFLSTIGPIFTSLMMAVGLRRLNIRNLTIMVFIKLSTTFFLIKWLGYPGSVISSLFTMGLYITMNAYALSENFKVHWVYTIRKILFIILGLLGMCVVSFLFSSIGFNQAEVGKMMALVQLGISGIVAVSVYVGITAFFQVPQTLFHFNFSMIMKKFKRG